MQKMLIFALLLPLLQLAANVQNGEQQQAYTDKQPAPSTPPAAQAKQGNSTTPCPIPAKQKDRNQPIKIAIIANPPKDRWDKTTVLIGVAGGVLSLGLLVVGIYGVCYARKTLRVLAKQTIAGKRAAQAALAQANHLVASERAWIVESINFPDQIPRQAKTGSAGIVVAIITLKNIGKQPAFLRTAETRFHMAESLPREPAFRFKEVFDDGFMLAPQEPILVRVLLEEGSFSDEEADQIERRFLTTGMGLYLYGRIAYDTIGIRGTNSFCYTWRNLMGVCLQGDKPGFEKKGPKGYNQHT